MATIVEDTFVNDPQIISVIQRGEASLEVLWAILNSRVASFYHFSASPKATKGLFPKILVGDVRTFPVPAGIEGVEGTAIQKLVAKAFKLNSQGKAAELQQVEAELEDAVVALYGFNSEDVAIIDRELLARA
jgi:hypothetical protein